MLVFALADMLELRLLELDSVVDLFVIAECPYTFSGLTKPLAFDLNRARFQRWVRRQNICNCIRHARGDICTVNRRLWLALILGFCVL
jgi:hypothetical protein